jgi:hypothetical protein
LGQVFINDGGFNNGVAFLNGAGIGFDNPILANGFGNVNVNPNDPNALAGLDLNSIALVNGSNRIAFVRDRFGRQVAVELRDGAVQNGVLVNPGLSSINQIVLNSPTGSGLFAGAGQNGAFLSGTANDIQAINLGLMGKRGPAQSLRRADEVVRIGLGESRRPLAQ